MGERLYTIYTFDLNSAGEETIDGPWGVVRMLDAVNAAGTVQPSAKISVKAERENEAAPVRLGQGFFATDTSRWVISWEAQAGVTATIGFAKNPRVVDWDADPAVQLLGGNLSLSRENKFGAYPHVTCGGGVSTNIINSVPTGCRAVWVQNVSAVGSVNIAGGGGSAASATVGLTLGPGERIRIEARDSLYAYNGGAAAVLVAVVTEEIV